MASGQKEIQEGLNSVGALADTRGKIIDEIRQDRTAWRVTIIPQIILLVLVAMTLGSISGYGLYLSVTAVRDGRSVDTLIHAARVFAGGSATALSFPLVKLFAKLSEPSNKFIDEERRFTKHIGKVRIASSKNMLVDVLNEYGIK